MKRLTTLAVGVAAIMSVSVSGMAYAEPKIYSDSSAFMSALPSSPRILDFDNVAPGTSIADAASRGGITFKYDFGGLSMKIAHLYATTSSPNFLGTGDGGMFHDGDDFVMTFEPGNAIGLYFISADPLLDGDITMSAGGVTARLNAGDVQKTLNDGSRVYFLGIVDAAKPLSSASIEALAGGFFLYNVDDIVTAPLSASSRRTASAGGEKLASIAAE